MCTHITCGLRLLSPDLSDGWRDWANIGPDILVTVIQKVQQRAAVDATETRRAVAVAGVCRSWRQAIQTVLDVNAFSSTGLLQFPCSLREAGPLDKPMQCVMRRKGGTFYLYQRDCTSGHDVGENKSSFLMGARKRWRPGHIVFMISAERRSNSCRSSGFMGKLRSNFWGSAFVLWDHQHCPPSAQDGTESKVKPVAFVRFTEEVVEGMGHRKMSCALKTPRAKPRSLNRFFWSHRGGNARFSSPSAKSFFKWGCHSTANDSISRSIVRKPKGYQSLREEISKSMMEETVGHSFRDVDHIQSKTKIRGVYGLLRKREKLAMLTSQIPVWDVQRQCWSMDFNGQKTLPSMHNFQLLMPSVNPQAVEGSSAGQTSDHQQHVVVMQLGKISKGFYALEFRYPLSAFQAFNIALCSFATTVGVEP